MNVIEAYDFTLEKLEELKSQGIEVEMIIPRSVRENNREIIEKYNKPNNLPVEKWRHVTLKVNSNEAANKVFEMCKYLGMAGISFDTGGWQGYRDWELDWSFSYKNKCNDQAIEGVEMIEELINSVKDNVRDDAKED